MRVFALFSRIRELWHVTKITEALASSQAALTKRLDELTEKHEDLVRQHGLQKSAFDKQLADLRAIVTQAREERKAQPVVARSMADVRRFTEEDFA